ncbi:histidine kinase dimerization/phospho-acceptor domain-containing protein [Desulfosarcina cetonica]|uniref:histidine kinase dimerization/phospho-acceptor domain-containing protein n=1 Tax=Desulfosarcina cetonica TaxID=90730 RepID=UPI000A46BF55|nr:histidine kinase dimerization/phospho-acceptor domain-containing protein [Desulfosarcina cetonica]
MAVIVTQVLLVILLAYLLMHQILNPVRALIMETCRNENIKLAGDDVKTLSMSVRGLIEDVDQTQVELEKSRENLLQAEKMAMVGKLAAGMAHSVRNPFTSVKMRLFSLSRSLKLSGMQKEDFDVISEEIDHIDTIVQNFLEFSRPPKLKMQPVSPSTVWIRPFSCFAIAWNPTTSRSPFTGSGFCRLSKPTPTSSRRFWSI